MNKHEAAISAAIQRRGWTVLDKGWPDFLCVNWSHDEISRIAANPKPHIGNLMREKPLHAFCIELKRGADKVRPEQAAIHAILNAAGIPCRVAREEDVECLINKKKPFIFSTPEQRSLITKKIEAMQSDLSLKMKELDRLSQSIKASTVLFDGDEPDSGFSVPESELIAGPTINDRRHPLDRMSDEFLSRAISEQSRFS